MRTHSGLGVLRGVSVGGGLQKRAEGASTQIFGQISTLSLWGQARRKITQLKICAGGPDFDFEPFGPAGRKIFKVKIKVGRREAPPNSNFEL